MRKYGILLVVLTWTFVHAQQDSVVLPEPVTLDIQFLSAEAMMNNLAIRSLVYKSDIVQSRVGQTGALDPPELRYVREGMPGFNYNEAMFSRIQLMQMLPFPSKLGTQKQLAEIQAEHADHDRLEKMNEVITDLKTSYFELWYLQQTIVLEQEGKRLMKQYASAAETRFSNGIGSQQDVLRARIEIANRENAITTLRQRELSAKAMIAAILNRPVSDTLGYAVIPEEIIFDANLDSLVALAAQARPMIVHDSLMIREGETMRSIAHQEYLPDFNIELEHMTAPAGNFQGWSVGIGVTLPFAPWAIGKISSQVEEADATINEARSSYQSTLVMVSGTIRDLYYKIESLKTQLERFRAEILPQSRMALSGALTSYENGTVDFLMLLDSYRSNLELTQDYFMKRMEFEQSIALLEREVGVPLK